MSEGLPVFIEGLAEALRGISRYAEAPVIIMSPHQVMVLSVRSGNVLWKHITIAIDAAVSTHNIKVLPPQKKNPDRANAITIHTPAAVRLLRALHTSERIYDDKSRIAYISSPVL